MVDNIKVNMPPAVVSSAKSVKPLDYRQNSKRNNLFKDTFKERQKKRKRKDRMHVKISASSALADKTPSIPPSAAKKKAKEFRQKRTIDIRV